MPHFSIIVPTYNRANEVGRAVRSCLAQSFSDFEVVVVDDGSTDNTYEVVEAFSDARVLLLRLPTNGGPNPARNIGIMRATGNWLVMLDSDMELLPGALAQLYERTQSAPSDVGNIASSCKWDSGLITPHPGVPTVPMDYVEYLGWLDKWQVTEYFNCFRRDVFSDVQWVNSRASEMCFHLAVARRWKISVNRKPAIIYHTDCKDRRCFGSPEIALRRLVNDAADYVAQSVKLVAEHGACLARFAPRTYSGVLNGAAMAHFLLGQRKKGFYWACRALVAGPWRLRNWATLTIGMLNPRVLAAVKVGWDGRNAALLATIHSEPEGA